MVLLNQKITFAVWKSQPSSLKESRETKTHYLTETSLHMIGIAGKSRFPVGIVLIIKMHNFIVLIKIPWIFQQLHMSPAWKWQHPHSTRSTLSHWFLQTTFMGLWRPNLQFLHWNINRRHWMGPRRWQEAGKTSIVADIPLWSATHQLHSNCWHLQFSQWDFPHRTLWMSQSGMNF